MSNNDFGGIMRGQFSDGTKFSFRGTFTVNPSMNEVAAITNQDGSIDRTFTPQPTTVEFNFADRGVDLNKLMSGDRGNFSISEDKTGVTHFLTNAFFTGNPQINRINGETTGIQCVTNRYNRKSAS